MENEEGEVSHRVYGGNEGSIPRKMRSFVSPEYISIHQLCVSGHERKSWKFQTRPHRTLLSALSSSLLVSSSRSAWFIYERGWPDKEIEYERNRERVECWIKGANGINPTNQSRKNRGLITRRNFPFVPLQRARCIFRDGRGRTGKCIWYRE